MPSKYERTATLIHAWHEVWGSSETIGIKDDIVHILRILHEDEKSNASRESTAEDIVDYLNEAFTMNAVSFDDEPTQRPDRLGEVSGEVEDVPRVVITPAKKRRDREAPAELTLASDQGFDAERSGGLSA